MGECLGVDSNFMYSEVQVHTHLCDLPKVHELCFGTVLNILRS